MNRLLEFFFLSRLHPKHSILVVCGCVAMGVWTMSYDPAELDSALGLVLVVQMFLASTAFASRAFSGHFDPLLVAGASRRRAAVAHLLVSISPGVAGWLVLAGTALALGNTNALSALWGRRVVSLVIVSTVSWVLGFRLTRGAAGVLWLTALVAVLLQQDLRALSMSLDQGVHAWPVDTAILLVCPFLLIGNKPFVPPTALVSAMLVCVAGVAVVVMLTGRMDVVLAERG